MKILIKLLLIILVMFSYLHSDTSALDKLYLQSIAQKKVQIKRDKSYLHKYNWGDAYYEKKIKEETAALKAYEEKFKKNPGSVYKTLYESAKKKLTAKTLMRKLNIPGKNISIRSLKSKKELQNDKKTLSTLELDYFLKVPRKSKLQKQKELWMGRGGKISKIIKVNFVSKESSRPLNTELRIRGKKISEFKKGNPVTPSFSPPSFTNAIAPPRTDQGRRKPQVSSSLTTKRTVLKNVNINSKVKAGNINTKGKVSLAHVKVANGSTLKNTKINANVDAQDISVGKGSALEVGSVNITK